MKKRQVGAGQGNCPAALFLLYIYFNPRVPLLSPIPYFLTDTPSGEGGGGASLNLLSLSLPTSQALSLKPSPSST